MTATHRHNLFSSFNICLILLFSIFAPARAQVVNSSIEKYVTNDLAVSKDGTIWIATSGFLARYNGSVYKIFNQENSDHIPSSNILCLYPEPDKDILWVGTEQGLSLIENGIAREIKTSFHDPVYSLTGYGEDKILLSSDDGLYLFEKKTHKVDGVYLNNDITNASHQMSVFGVTWVATENQITILNKDFVQTNKIEYGSNVSITDLCFDNGRILVGTTSGLFIYTYSGEPIPIPANLQSLTQGCKIHRCIYDPFKNQVLIAIEEKGYNYYDFVSNQSKRAWDSENLHDLFSLSLSVSEEFIFSSKNGRELEIWSIDSGSRVLLVPGFKKGETVIGLHASPFNVDEVIMISSFCIYALDVNTGRFKTLVTENKKDVHHYKRSFVDSKNNLWVSDKEGYLSKFVINGNNYSLKKRYDVTVPEIELWESRNGNVSWVNGNDICSIVDDRVVITSTTDNLLSKHTYSAIDGDIYLFGDKGLFRYGIDSEKEVFSRINFSQNDINVIYEDKKERLWIGTESSGIAIISTETGEVTIIDKENGLAENSIMDIVGNGLDEVWVAQKHNLSRIMTESLVVTGYQNSFVFIPSYIPRNGIFLKDSSGKDHYVFNLGRNAISISPEEFIISNRREARLGIDYVYVNNQRVDQKENMTLDPDADDVSFNFSATQFQIGTQLNYSYWLEGYDKTWSIPSKVTRADYSKLPKGHYVFRVKVQTPDGKWNEDELAFPFSKKASFFEKTGVRATILIILLLGLAVIARLVQRYRNIQFEAKIAEAEKNISKKSYKDKMFFLTNVSHEYRTPLSMIYGPASMLLDSKDIKGDNKTLVSLIVKNASKMMDLTEKMMDFNKKETDLESLKVTSADMTSAINNIADGFKFLLEEKEINLSIEGNEDEHITGFFDMEKVERTIGNLLSNAIKYTPKGGNISIKPTKTIGKYIKVSYPDANEVPDHESFIEVEVKDSGIGVPQEHLDKLFQRFERVLQEVEDGNIPSGFGVGLNYILYLIKKHHGFIKYEPNDPWGSCFSFAIPSSKESYSQDEIVFDSAQIKNHINSNTKATDDSSEQDLSEKHEILIVDDNPDIRQYLEIILSDFCTVWKSANGDEALEYMSQKSPEIVISDVMMPYKDGIELCNEIKSNNNYCHIPVILLTAKNDVEDRLEGLRVGADAYIAKPFNPDVLKETVRGILRNRKRLQDTLKSKTSISNVDEFIKQNIEAKDKEFLEKMYSILDENISNEDYSLKQLASGMNMSYSSFYQKVKALLGSTPQELLISYRLNRAMELLKEHNLNVSEVCYKVGFSSLPGFSRSFKNQFGVPPSAI